MDNNPKPKSRRGGRRPGAGAPKGNMNAFKHGRRSRQLANAAAAMINVPGVAEAFIRYANRASDQQVAAAAAGKLYMAGIFRTAWQTAHSATPNLGFLDSLERQLRAAGIDPQVALRSSAPRKRLMGQQSAKKRRSTPSADTESGRSRKNRVPSIKRQIRSVPHDQSPNAKTH